MCIVEANVNEIIPIATREPTLRTYIRTLSLSIPGLPSRHVSNIVWMRARNPRVKRYVKWRLPRLNPESFTWMTTIGISTSTMRFTTWNTIPGPWVMISCGHKKKDIQVMTGSGSRTNVICESTGGRGWNDGHCYRRTFYLWYSIYAYMYISAIFCGK